MNTLLPFNVRVYGLLLHRKNILLSDELHQGNRITKFPGGGLQFGEGTISCVIREFKEELGITIRVRQHFYTTDFFQASAFNPEQQVISIYYLVETDEVKNILSSDMAFDFDTEEGKFQSFRWVTLDELQVSELTLPIDRHVIKLLKKK
ncbi:MAG TPA: NUDIX domain-containing protein [Bacteroidia bacterium]|nr:NUDIX domain-containing protein [Bacteroidia bacterium]